MFQQKTPPMFEYTFGGMYVSHEFGPATPVLIHWRALLITGTEALGEPSL